MDMAVVRSQLAPTGVLRAGINLSNFLLVTSRDEASALCLMTLYKLFEN